MKKYILLPFLIIILSLSSCSGVKKPIAGIDYKKEDISKLPQWVLDPTVKNGIGGVGIASPSKGGLMFQIPRAENDAKANIAARIGSEISRITKNSLREAGVNGQSDVENFFSQATKDVVKNTPLSGVKRINIHQAKDGTLYVHMVLENEDYSEYLKNGQRIYKDRIAKSSLAQDSINKTQGAVADLFKELDLQ